MKRRSLTVLTVVATFVLASSMGACGADNKTAKDAKGEGPQGATIAIGTDTKSTPVFVGKERGIYLKHGIDLELLLLPTGVEMSTALQAGQAQFAAPSISNAPIAREQGIQEVAVVGIMNDSTVPNFDNPVGIVGRPEAGGRANDIKSIRGKRIGVAVGGTGDLYLRALLTQAGMTAKDVKMVNLTDPGDTISAFRNGSVDAVATWEPALARLLDAVPGSLIIERGGNHLGYVMLGYASEKVIKDDNDLVQRFVTATAEAAHYTRTHLDEAAEIASHWLHVDAAILRKALENERYDPRLSEYTTQAWTDAVSMLVKQGKLQNPTDRSGPERSINGSFMKKVQTDNPDFFKDLSVK